MEQKEKNKVFTQEIKNFYKRCREKSRNWPTKNKNKILLGNQGEFQGGI